MRSSLAGGATNEDIWIAECWVFHDLEKKWDDRVETLETKVETEEGLCVAGEDRDEITDVRKGIEGGLL